MRKLLIKELREHAALGILALVILTLLVHPRFTHFRFLKDYPQNFDFNSGVEIQPLLSAFILKITALTLALFGFILGSAQILSDKHRDMWAFLIHRPVTKTGIFGSKIMVGLSIYLTTAILYLLVFVLYVRQPGRIPGPFEWAMVLPLVANIMAGILWYFTGVLSCLRNARKLGTATAPFATAVFFNLVAVRFPVFPEFYQSAIVLLLGIAILGFAAWGAFLSDDRLNRQPLVARFSLGCILTVFGFALVFCIMRVALSFGTRQSHVEVGQTDSYHMRKDGTILRAKFETNGAWRITFLDGTDAINASTIKLMDTNFLAPSSPLTFPSNPKYWQNPDRYFKQWRFQNGVLWLSIRNGELRGYNPKNGQLVGNIVPLRLTNSHQLKEEPFLPGPMLWLYRNPEFPYLATASSVYEIDLAHQKAKQLYACEASDAIQGIVPMAGGKLGVLKVKTFAVINDQGKELGHFPLKAEWDFAHKEVFSLEHEGEYAISIAPQPTKKSNSVLPGSREVHYFGGGAVERKTVVIPAVPAAREPGNDEKLFPIAYPFLVMVLYQKFDSVSNSVLVMSGVGGFLCAPIGWLMGRRYQFSGKSQFCWVLYLLLFGFSGLVAFLGLHEWPMRVRCKGCGKLRPIDSERCGNCGQAFEPATTAGIEIVEASPVQA